MKYIQELMEGMAVRDIYYCKQKNAAVTKNGKDYWNVILQDKTGTMDAKVWDVNSPSVVDFSTGDYVYIYGEVSSFNGALQITVKQTRPVTKEECNPNDFFPVSSKNIDEMWEKLKGEIASVENKYLKKLLEKIFIEDEAFSEKFKKSSAAKSVHHGFIGGLLEHTLSVTANCEFFSEKYPVLKRDLLISAALLHDVGKVKELSLFPENDYTDEGNLMGHIYMGAQMVGRVAEDIDDFPPTLLAELTHCILAHHGKLEYGSPKVPALVEAIALNFADDMDAKMELFTELSDKVHNTEWQGFNRLLDTNVRLTKGE